MSALAFGTLVVCPNCHRRKLEPGGALTCPDCIAISSVHARFDYIIEALYNVWDGRMDAPEQDVSSLLAMTPEYQSFGSLNEFLHAYDCWLG